MASVRRYLRIGYWRRLSIQGEELYLKILVGISLLFSNATPTYVVKTRFLSNGQNLLDHESSSSIIPRLVKHMVSVSSNTLALEDGGEAQILWHLIFRDNVIRAFGLTNDEFADLEAEVSIASSNSFGVLNQNLT